MMTSRLKKSMLAAAWIVVAGGGSAATAQQGGGAITGLWSTGSNGGRVELYRCGAAICGKVDDAAPLRANSDHRDVNNPDRKLRDRRLKGLVVLRGSRADLRNGSAALSMTLLPAKVPKGDI